jgi:hypothetical protein
MGIKRFEKQRAPFKYSPNEKSIYRRTLNLQTISDSERYQRSRRDRFGVFLTYIFYVYRRSCIRFITCGGGGWSSDNLPQVDVFCLLEQHHITYGALIRFHSTPPIILSP